MGNLVEITRFYDPEEACCAQGFLRARGIETFLHNEHHLTMAPWLRVALGGYRLVAFAGQVSDAKLALDEINAITPVEDETYENRRNWAWLPLAFLAGVPFVLRYRSWSFLFVQWTILAAFLCGFFLMHFV